jgi:hypothetical protein
MTAWLVSLSIVFGKYFNSILGIWGFGIKIKEKEIKADR